MKMRYLFPLLVFLTIAITAWLSGYNFDHRGDQVGRVFIIANFCAVLAALIGGAFDLSRSEK